MGTDLNAEPTRKYPHERDVLENKPNLPFSLKYDNVNVSKPMACRIPAFTGSTFGKPQGNKALVTKSQNLNESDFALDGHGKRPSPFSLSSSQLGCTQRRPYGNLSKSGGMLGLKQDAALKTEDKLFTLCQGSEITAVHAHTPTHLSSSPPIIQELTNPSWDFMSSSQRTSVAPNFFPQKHRLSQAQRTKSKEIFSRDSLLRLSASPRPFDSLGEMPFPVNIPADDIKPPSSRSRSTTLMLPHESEQDISTLLMLGAAEARNCKADLAEQRREGAKLIIQLEAVTKEKANLEHKLEAAKAATRKLVDASDAKYKDLELMFRALKDESQRSLAFVEEARITMSNLKQTQERALDSLKVIEPFLDENGTYSKPAEIKGIINELQAENVRCQQVIDLLRDKLHILGSELVEARARVTELEANQIMEGTELKRSAASLSSSALKIEELMKQLARRESESIEALQCAASAESKLLIANERIEQLVQTLGDKEASLEQMWHLQEENSILKLQLDERMSLIANLESAQKEISTKLDSTRDFVSEQQIKTGVLEEKARSQEEIIECLKQSLQKSNAQSEENQSTIQRLQDELKTSAAGELITLSKHEQSVEKIALLENELAQIRRALTANEETAQQAKRRYEVLQERFEDQSVTLRITKELNGDLQERLVTTEAMHAAKLESETGKLRLELAVLQEQKSNLDILLENLKEKAVKGAESHAKAISDALGDFEKKLAQQESSSNRILQAEERRANRAEKDLGETKKELLVVKKELEDSTNIVAVLNEKLAVVHSELEVTKECGRGTTTAPALLDEISRLEKEIQDLVNRAKNVNERYKLGDLSDEEREFVHSLIQMSQSIHEQEMVSKANELRRRDTTIKTLQARIGALESTLARHLQAKAQTEPGTGSSMIDLKAWMTSSPVSADGPAANPVVTASNPCATQADIALSGEVAPTGITTLPQQVDVPFSILDRSEDTNQVDSGDDTPLSELTTNLGKRERRTNSLIKGDKNDDVTRPTRRMKTTTQKTELQAGSGTKTTRTKKRR